MTNEDEKKGGEILNLNLLGWRWKWFQDIDLDAAWCGDKDDRKWARYCFFLDKTPISWCSKKESVVALSTCESEYIAAAMSACQDDRLPSFHFGFWFLNYGISLYKVNSRMALPGHLKVSCH